MSNLLRVATSGPLSVFADAFAEDLVGHGYRPGTAAKHLQLMAHLSRWMEAHDLETGALGRVQIEQFVLERRAFRTELSSARAMVPLLGYLRALSVVPPAASREARTPAGALLDRYADYLRMRRGVKAGTVRNYCNHARAFFTDRERLVGTSRSRRWTSQQSTTTCCASRAV